MNYQLIIIISTLFLIILLLFFKYRTHWEQTLESFRRRRRRRGGGGGGGSRRRRRGRRGGRRRRCRRSCGHCVFNSNPSVKKNKCRARTFKKHDVCPSKIKKCKKQWDKDFISGTVGDTQSFFNSFYSNGYGMENNGTYSNKNNNLNALQDSEKSLKEQKKLLKKLLRHRKFNNRAHRKKKKSQRV